MIEILTGIAMLAAAAAALLGMGEGLLPFPVSTATAAFVAALGLLLAAHGIYRVKLGRGAEDRHRLRSSALMWIVLLLMCLLALAVPVAAPFLNAFRIAGFPLGYYMVSQGVPIGLVMLAFLHAWRAAAVDDRDAAGED
jgi:putative solute:sodium symporter small subunit